MKNRNVKKQKPISLELHNGCKDCGRVCKFNRPVTTKLKNSQATKQKFKCNSSK